MEITIHIRDGGHWEGQYSFTPLDGNNQHSFKVIVPDVSRQIEDKVLRTPTGSWLSALMIVTYGRLGVDGFRNDVPHRLPQWHV